MSPPERPDQIDSNYIRRTQSGWYSGEEGLLIPNVKAYELGNN